MAGLEAAAVSKSEEMRNNIIGYTLENGKIDQCHRRRKAGEYRGGRRTPCRDHGPELRSTGNVGDVHKGQLQAVSETKSSTYQTEIDDVIASRSASKRGDIEIDESHRRAERISRAAGSCRRRSTDLKTWLDIIKALKNFTMRIIDCILTGEVLF